MVKKIAIEHLAGMVQRGFADTAKDMKNGFEGVHKRLDKIESVLIKRHDEEIEKLKVRVKDLEDLFAMPVKK